MAERRRVVVTGMGVVSPLGNTLDEFWTRVIAGESGISKMTLVDTDKYPCKVAGEIRDWDHTRYMDRKDGRRMARFSQFAIGAARMAIEDAHLNLEGTDLERVGVIMGNGGGGLQSDEEAVRTMDTRGGMKVDPFFVSKRLNNMAGANIASQMVVS